MVGLISSAKHNPMDTTDTPSTTDPPAEQEEYVMVGSFGGRYLRDALTRQNPAAVITRFQELNGTVCRVLYLRICVYVDVYVRHLYCGCTRATVLWMYTREICIIDVRSHPGLNVGTCQPALPLLDLHAIPRMI